MLDRAPASVQALSELIRSSLNLSGAASTWIFQRKLELKLPPFHTHLMVQTKGVRDE